MSRLVLRGVDLALGGREVLRALDCELAPGVMLGIIGPNGAGKSSLLRVMAGLLKPGRGEVLLDDRPLSDWPRNVRARRVAYLPQAAPLHWPLAVRAVVELGRLPWRSGWFGADEGAPRAVSEAMRLAEIEAIIHFGADAKNDIRLFLDHPGCRVLVNVRQTHVGVLGEVDLADLEMVRVKIGDAEFTAQ